MRGRKTVFALALVSAMSSSAFARDGNLDKGFFDGGRQYVPMSAPFGGALGSGYGVLQSDGSVVVAGSSDLGGGGVQPDVHVRRLSAAGMLDMNYGGTGETVVAFDRGGNNADYVSGMAIQNNGRVLVSGVSDGNNVNATGADCFVFRLTTNGALDPQFSTDGKAVIGFDYGPPTQQGDLCSGLVLQQDQQILVYGATTVPAGNAVAMAIARLDSSGSPDLGFNNTGKRMLSFGAGDIGSLAYKAVESPDHGILLVGIAATAAGYDWGIAKLSVDGSDFPGFGSGGRVRFHAGVAGGTQEAAGAVLALPDNSFIVAGQAQGAAGSGTNFAVAKFHADGSVDTGFGIGGKRVIAFDYGGDNNESANSLALDSQGRILVGGQVNVGPSNSDFIVVRLLADGSLDPSFGTAGRINVELAAPPLVDTDETSNSLLLAPDGGIVIVGSGRNQQDSNHPSIGVAKLIGDTVFENDFESE